MALAWPQTTIRPRAIEILVDDTHVFVIRERESIQDLFRE
jgi:hypothetical protein